MSQNTKPKTFEEVQTQEKEALGRRRQAAGLQSDLGRPFHTVGLALSGGGIRSAAFNLGLLQAFHDEGLLAQVDYLSAVSGGSYVGACLPEITPTPRKPIVSDPNRDKTTHRLILGGLYLNRPGLLLNHWLCGTFLNLAIVFSGLLLLTCALAWVYRLLDSIDTMLYFSTLGISSDIGRAFVPCAVFVLGWLMVRVVVFAVNYMARTPGRTRWELLLTGLAVLIVVSALMAVAALLNTDDISLGLTDWLWLDVQKDVNAAVGYMRYGLLVLLVVALLPYLRPQDLLRSGAQPKSVVHTWVYWVASYALLFGIPLMLFGYLARENISGYNEHRPSRHQLERTFVADWKEFLNPPRQVPAFAGDTSDAFSLPHLVVMVAAAGVDPGDELRRLANNPECASAVSRSWADMVQRDPHQKIARVMRLEAESRKDDQKWFWERWQAWTPPWGSWRQHYIAERQDLHTEIARNISEYCLKHPQFYAVFRNLPKADEKTHLPPNWTEVTVRKLVDYRERAAWLAAGLPSRKEELLALNGELFRTYYGKLLRDPSIVFATIVQPADQDYRLILMIVFFGLFLVLALGISLNATSMHRFYRDRLAKMWLPGREAEMLADTGPVESVDRAAPVPSKYSHLPYYLINATANLQGRLAAHDEEPLEVFEFSPLFCGSRRTNYLPTDKFHGGRYRLADAIAVSGAAVSPAVMHDPVRMVLLFLTNSRTGQWLWNPKCWNDEQRSRWAALCWPTALTRMLAFYWKKPEERAYLFISDGGHLENLGVESLLHRRCRVMIVSDATYDPEDKFQDLVKLLRRMRILQGIQVRKIATQDTPLRLDALVPRGEEKLARRHFLIAEISYPKTETRNEETGCLIYVKPTFTGDEAPELLHYRKDNDKFPHDPTLDQFYDPRRFECYRLLGHHIGSQVAQALESGREVRQERPWLADWNPPEIESRRQADSRDEILRAIAWQRRAALYQSALLEIDRFEKDSAYQRRVISEVSNSFHRNGRRDGPGVAQQLLVTMLPTRIAACYRLAGKKQSATPMFRAGGKQRLVELVVDLCAPLAATIRVPLLLGNTSRDEVLRCFAGLALGIHEKDVFCRKRTKTACYALFLLLDRFSFRPTDESLEVSRWLLRKLVRAIREGNLERVTELLLASFHHSPVPETTR